MQRARDPGQRHVLGQLVRPLPDLLDVLNKLYQWLVKRDVTVRIAKCSHTGGTAYGTRQ